MHAPMRGGGLSKVRGDLASQKTGGNKLKWGDFVLLLATEPAPMRANVGIFVTGVAASRFHATSAREPVIGGATVLSRMMGLAAGIGEMCGHSGIYTEAIKAVGEDVSGD